MSVSPFFCVIGFTVEPKVHNFSQRERRREAAHVVSPAAEAFRELKFSDTIRIEILHPVVDVFKTFL